MPKLYTFINIGVYTKLKKVEIYKFEIHIQNYISNVSLWNKSKK